jgi:hypothetical protein
MLGSLARQRIPPGDLSTILETELHALPDNGEASGEELGSFLVAQSDILVRKFASSGRRGKSGSIRTSQCQRISSDLDLDQSADIPEISHQS